MADLCFNNLSVVCCRVLDHQTRTFSIPKEAYSTERFEENIENLGTISSFRELKDMVLVDIVSTLQVTGGAIVFQYKDEVEIICEGKWMLKKFGGMLIRIL